MALAADLLAATPAAEHKAHQRGVATLEPRVERQRLNLRLETPLDNLVGFDRAPRTAAERAAVERALAPLHDPAAPIQVDGAAGCTLRASRIEALVLEVDCACRDVVRAGHSPGRWSWSPTRPVRWARACCRSPR